MALVLCAIVLVIHAPIVLGGQTWDDVRYHTEVAPPRIAAADAVLHGELPTWWNGTGLGVPLLGEPSHGAAYPIGWLAATPHALDLLAILHVLWCALGVFVWARRMRASDVGALAGGVLVAASGVIASAAIRGALPALAHLPWIAFVASRLSTSIAPRARVRWTVSLAILIGLVGLAGQLAVLAQAIALALLAGRRPSRLTAVGVLAGLAIASVQWLPAALAIGDGAGATVHGIPIARVIELVVPIGHEASGWFPSVFVGAPLLALASLSAPRRRFAILAGVLALLALVAGRGGGWPAWLGAPELHLAALALVAAPHAAVGFDVIARGERRSWLALAAAAVASALGLAGVAVLRTHADATAIDAIDRALIGAALGLACCAIATVIAWRARPALPRVRGVDLRALVLVALVVAPSVGALPLAVPRTGRAIVDEPPAWAASALAPGELTLVDDQPVHDARPVRVFRPVTTFSGGTRARPEALADALATLAGTSAAKWGIASARSDDPARPAVHDRVWLAAASAGGQLLDRYGIALAVLPASMAGNRGLQGVARRGDLALVRYPASPPAALVREWIFVPDVATALARLFPPGAGRGLGSGLVVLAGTGAENQDEPGPAQPCTIDRWSGAAIDLHCASDRPAYAVVSSSPARGWSVSVDGRASPWLVADVLRRAVAVGAGEHQIAWRYWPPGLTIALVLAALGSMGLLALWLVHGRDPDARDRTPDPERADVN